MSIANLRRLYALLDGYRWAIPVVIVLGLAASLSEGLTIGLIIPLLDVLFDGTNELSADTGLLAPLMSVANHFDEGSRVYVLLTAALALVSLKSLVVYGDTLLSCWISGRVTDRLRRAAARQILDVGFSYLATTDTGRLTNTIDSEIWKVADLIGTMFSIVTRVCIIVVFVTLLLLVSPILTLTVLALMAAISTAIHRFAKPVARLGHEAVTAAENLSERTIEIIDGVRMIRAFGQEAREEQRFGDASERVRLTAWRQDLISGAIDPILEVLYVPVLLSAIVIAAWSGLGVGALLAYLLLLYRLQPHIRAIDDQRIHLAALAAGVANVFALLDRSDKPYVGSGRTPFTAFRDRIEFRSVRFSYSGASERPTIADASLTIRQGQVTAIVGASGAGKSTVVNLLFRFYDPVAGEILVDGTPLPEFRLDEWRRQLATAGQDADLMSGTVLENILYGSPDGTREQAIEAARQADAHDFISELPSGYDTRIGERGLLLSGGQRQRIGLARALVCRPAILVLDEATNALDCLSERSIQRALDMFRGDRSVIVIAHRLSTVANADHIIVLDEGTVAEQGPPEALLRQPGTFAMLYSLQTAVDLPPASEAGPMRRATTGA